MADVRLLVIPTVVGLLTVQRAASFGRLPLAAWAFVGAGTAVVLLGRRAAPLLVGVIGLTMLRTFQNHLLFGFWTISTWYLFTHVPQRRIVHRAQLSILYTFAGLAKVTPAWLSGAPLQRVAETVGRPVALPDHVAIVMATGTAALELALAVVIWLPIRRAWVLTAGVALHAGITLSFLQWEPPILFYNGLALLWLWDATRHTPASSHLGERA